MYDPFANTEDERSIATEDDMDDGWASPCDEYPKSNEVYMAVDQEAIVQDRRSRPGYEGRVPSKVSFNRAPFRLLDLAPELLLQVITHVVKTRWRVYPVELCDPSHKYRHLSISFDFNRLDNLHGGFKTKFRQLDMIRSSFRIQPALARTNRHLRETTLAAYYKVNEFVLTGTTVHMGQPYPWLRFPTASSAIFLGHLRRVCFPMSVYFTPGYPIFCSVMLKLLTEPPKRCIVLGGRSHSTEYHGAQQEWYDRLDAWLNGLDDVVDGFSLLRASVLVTRRVPFLAPASKNKIGLEYKI